LIRAFVDVLWFHACVCVRLEQSGKTALDFAKLYGKYDVARLIEVRVAT
jgi:hypothetical protein